MTAELATALRETADRALVNANFRGLFEDAARTRLLASALRLAEAVLRGEKPEQFVAIYAERRAEWIAQTEAGEDAFSRARAALESAVRAEDALATANPFTADESAWTNERALQQAATEKEAHHA